jgi:biopolymer transport protein ExbB
VSLAAAQAWLASFWAQARDIWLSGGWAMIPIAIIALLLFAMGMHVLLRLRETGFEAVPERTWRSWIATPGTRQGPVGDLIGFVAGAHTVAESSVAFEQLRVTETAPFERDLRVMKVCVSAAPLFGLLGTVTGMLATFGALASGSGGEKTMAAIARGISEALITTETGLVIALPGLFFQYQLARKYERYKAFLAHLESVFTQALFHKSRRAA